MKNIYLLGTMLLCLTVGVGCSAPVEYEETWLDSPSVTDPCLSDPSCLVSTRPGLTPADRSRPVLITAHGYTASSYEWGEFRRYAEEESGTLVSLVMLGAHGRSIGEFEESTWEDWGQPIIAEYQALVEQGYTNISLAGSSTGGALILHQLSEGAYERRAPRHFFFIDPIVVPGDKMLTLANVLAPILGNVPSEDMTEEERRHWYTNRPAETLKELYALTRRVRARLAEGFSLPAGSQAKVFKTSRDEVADPVSALLIYRGLRDVAGNHVEVEMLDSGLHVFTRLQGRDPADVAEADRDRQQRAFREIVARLRDAAPAG